MAPTTTKARPQRPEAPPPPKETDQAVAVFQAPRLPWHPAIQERYGVDRGAWRTLTDSVFPAAKTSDAICLAISYCQARKLDVFKKVVHIVPIWDSAKGREIESVWPGIGEVRTTAHRTHLYAGMDVPEFGPMVTKKFKARVKERGSNDWRDEEATVTFPEWCRITVYKMVKDEPRPFPGPKVVWLEYYTKKSRWSELPNEQWTKKSQYMLEKCAEAGALRRAFPEELGDEFTAEEAGFFGAYNAKPVAAEVVGHNTPNKAAEREPTREDFQQNDEQPGAGGEQRQPDGAGEEDPEDPAPNNSAPGGEGSGAAKSTPTDDAAAGAVHSQSEGGAGHTPDADAQKRSWKISDDIVGQDNKIAALMKLLREAEFTADVDEIAKVNAEFIGKTGRKKAEIEQTIASRRQVLAKGED